MGNSSSLNGSGQKSQDSLSSPQAVRIVDDPRSPAVEFTRTPIEVVGNQQQRSRRRNRTVSEETLDLLGSNPTNIGNFLHGDHESMENMMKQFHKFRILDADPRSPSQGIVRTPIAVYTVHGSSSPISANVASPILDVVTNSNCKEATPMETEAILKDPRSPITEVIRTPIQLPIWNDENGTPKLSKPPSEKRNKDNAEILAKKLFGTPEFKDSPLQMRAPLRAVGNSPHHILRAKQSRGINAEIGRVSGVENTPPPCLNKYDLAITTNKLKVDGNQQQKSRRRNRTKSEEALDSLDSSPTNIGNFLLGENEETMDTEMTQFHKLRILDADPRSPSEDIVRTPIMVYTEPKSSSPVSENVASPILDVVTNSNCKEAAPMETEAVLQDPRSPITEVVRTPIQLPIWNDENGTPKLSKPPSEKRNKENAEILAKKLFGTPEFKDSPLQMRTPLRAVGNSPHHILRAKQSCGINAEISRVSGVENTPPPCLNKYDLATTTNKLKVQNSTHWGQDSTFII